MNNSIQVAIQPQTGAIMARVPSSNAAALVVGTLLGLSLGFFIASRMK